MNTVHQTDFLVIGGGGAAGRAAIEAAQKGVSVTVVMKETYLHSGATAYQVSEMAGFNVGDGVCDKTDSPQGHYEDIMAAADGMAEPELARIVADEAQDTLKTLQSWGVPYEMDGDHFLAFKSCFSTKPRTHVIKRHGEPILKAMGQQLERYPITWMEKSMALELLQDASGRCVGAVIADQENQLHVIYAKATLLATGGAGQVFEKNLNPADVTGDGYALGFRAGAELINMEFMQAGIGISYPFTSLLNAYIWAGQPALTNRLGEQFLEKELPDGICAQDVMLAHSNHFPFSCSDNSYLLENAVQKQIQEGFGTDEGGAYMDLRHMTDTYIDRLDERVGLKKMWPIAKAFYASCGVDVSKEPVQIACFAHAINGGLRIDTCGRTTVPGLYAAGETAGGPHGADRLGGNMLLTCQIYGRRAAEAAVEEIAGIQTVAEDPQLAQKLEGLKHLMHKDIDCAAIRQQIQHLAQRTLLVRRTEQGLRTLISETEKLLAAIISAPECAQPDSHVPETVNLLTAARLMAYAAAHRKESRGAHYRPDYPRKNDHDYGAPCVLRRDGDAVVFHAIRPPV